MMKPKNPLLHPNPRKDPIMRDLFVKMWDEGKTTVEIGAHWGQDSRWARRVAESLRSRKNDGVVLKGRRKVAKAKSQFDGPKPQAEARARAKDRDCMCCGERFKSEHKGVRMCAFCRRDTDRATEMASKRRGCGQGVASMSMVDLGPRGHGFVMGR